MIEQGRILEFKDFIQNESTTKQQFENRAEVLSRIYRYIKESVSDEELYSYLIKDFPAWAAFYLNGDNGKPLFLAKWQIEYSKLMDNFPKVWAFCTRKSGKSTLLSAKILFNVCKNDYKRIVCLAPTIKQVFVFDDIRKFLIESPFLTETYVNNGGKNVSEEIYLTNHSKILKHTIGLQSRGALIRGEKGDTLIIDEMQLIERDIMSSVIKPILWDTYSQKSLNMIGTPSLDANPELNFEWDSWQKCENIECGKLFTKPYQLKCSHCGIIRQRAVYHLGWERAVREGCIPYNRVVKDMESMTPDEIDMEIHAIFPTQSGRFFPLQSLFDCGQKYKFQDMPTKGKTYVMSVDWAKQRDKTQMIIAEVRGDELFYVYYYTIDPKKGIVDYDVQMEFVKHLFHLWDVSWIIVDATGIQDVFVDNLTKAGKESIPKGSFYKDEKKRYGYIATDISNYEMWRNHRQQIINQKIHYPKLDEVFKRDWIKEHNQLKKKPIKDATLIKLVAPRNGYKDMAVCSAMLSLYIKDMGKSPPWFGVGDW